jgi:Tfp pilus assembly protein FimT
MVVVCIALIMLKISLPYINNSMTDLRLGSSASSLAGAVQSARYLAISNGTPVELTVNYATLAGQQTYQISAEGSSPVGCATAFCYYCQGNSGWVIQTTPACPMPFASSGISVTTVNTINPGTLAITNSVALSSTTPIASLQFNPNGMVTAATGTTTSPPMNFALVLTPSNNGQTKTVNISGAGYVKVTVP